MTRQWQVTANGLDSVEPDAPYFYDIDAHRLGELMQPGGHEEIIVSSSGEVLLICPIHMAGKRWIDIDDFERAFREALVFHGLAIDPAVVDASFRQAREKRRRLGLSA